MRRVSVVLVIGAIAPGVLLAATHTVNVGPGLAFNPSALTVQAGDTVTWSFLAPNHTTTSDATTGPEVWDSGIVPTGGTFSHVFSTVGSHPYYCAVHSFPGGTFMNGVINVAAPPAPVLTGVDPATGPTAGGTPTTLSGTDFVADCAASFGGVAATTSFVDANTLQATTPPHASAVVDVAVTCSTGGSVLPGSFTYADTLVLTSVTPSSGAPGTEVVLEGSNFDPAISIQFGTTPSAVTFVDSATVRVIVPTLPPGPVTITAANPSGAPATIAFTVLDATASGVPLFPIGTLLLLAGILATAGWLRLR